MLQQQSVCSHFVRQRFAFIVRGTALFVTVTNYSSRLSNLLASYVNKTFTFIKRSSIVVNYYICHGNLLSLFQSTNHSCATLWTGICVLQAQDTRCWWVSITILSLMTCHNHPSPRGALRKIWSRGPTLYRILGAACSQVAKVHDWDLEGWWFKHRGSHFVSSALLLGPWERSSF